MDDSRTGAPTAVPGNDRTVTAGPSGVAGVLQLLAAVALAVVGAVGVLDRPGQLLAVPVVLGLAVAGTRDLVLRPVVRADVAGLSVVTGVRRVRVAWYDVERLRVVTERRAPLLEVDLGEVLVVLGRRRLGRAPEAVLAELQQLRPGPAGPPDPALPGRPN